MATPSQTTSSLSLISSCRHRLARAIAAIHSTTMSTTNGTMLSFARSHTKLGIQLVEAYPYRLLTVQRQNPGSEPVSRSAIAPAARPAAIPPPSQAAALHRLPARAPPHASTTPPE